MATARRWLTGRGVQGTGSRVAVRDVVGAAGDHQVDDLGERLAHHDHLRLQWVNPG